MRTATRPIRLVSALGSLVLQESEGPGGKNSAARSHAVMVPAKIVKFPKLAPEVLEPFRR